ncbi:hypothetical protein V6U90_24005 [Micromonospora sp. CPCC 206060]|uniref:hypothetical protein n=1 Tax=Micromonospora sp. CPCC 206060 TaxID=3122406 RepID=UPI002FF1DCB0
MTGPYLSAAQLRSRMVLAARWIVTEHWPADDGRCPVCRVPDCLAIASAHAYLDATGTPHLSPGNRP